MLLTKLFTFNNAITYAVNYDINSTVNCNISHHINFTIDGAINFLFISSISLSTECNNTNTLTITLLKMYLCISETLVNADLFLTIQKLFLFFFRPLLSTLPIFTLRWHTGGMTNMLTSFCRFNSATVWRSWLHLYEHWQYTNTASGQWSHPHSHQLIPAALPKTSRGPPSFTLSPGKDLLIYKYTPSIH